MPMQAERGGEGIDANRRWVLSTMLQPLYPRKRAGTHRKGGWVELGPVWTARKISPASESDPRTLRSIESHYTCGSVHKRQSLSCNLGPSHHLQGKRWWWRGKGPQQRWYPSANHIVSCSRRSSYRWAHDRHSDLRSVSINLAEKRLPTSPLDISVTWYRWKRKLVTILSYLWFSGPSCRWEDCIKVDLK
jgi:hypothetical protein